MLRYLRENTGSWIIKFFLLIIVVVFVFLGIGSIKSGKNDTVAVVDGKSISVQEFQTAYKNMVERMRQQFGDYFNEDLLKALNLEKQALDKLINQKLVENQSKKFGITVSDKELADQLAQIPVFQKDGVFDAQVYKNILAANSITPVDFEDLQRSAIKEQKLMGAITDTVVVSDIEARQWYSYVNTRMSLDYLLVAPENLSATTPSMEEIETDYKNNESSYKSQPKRKVQYIEFAIKDYMNQVKINQEQIEAFYQQNQARFNVPEKVEARHILIKTSEKEDKKSDDSALKKAVKIYERAVAGEDFAALAQEFSQGPSKDNGGYLGSFARGQMVKSFEDKAFSLEAGQISKPVKTEFGWHVIQVLAKHDADIRTIDQVSSEISEELVLQEAKGLAYEAAGNAFDAVIDGDDFEQVALIAQKKIQATKEFDQTGAGLEMPDSQNFAQKAFELKPQTISDVIQFNDRYYIIKVADIIESVTLPLDKVKDKIVAKIQVQEQKENAKTKAQEILDKVNAGTDFKKAASSHNLELASTELFSRKQSIPQLGGGQELTKAAFELTKEKPFCDKVMETAKGFVLIRFKSREEPSMEEMDSRLESIRTQLVQLQKRQYYQEWLASLKDKADVKIKEKF